MSKGASLKIEASFQTSLPIDIGYALNIYGPRVRDDLDNVRRIRNAFGHELEVRNFDHADVPMTARLYMRRSSSTPPHSQTHLSSGRGGKCIPTP